MKLRKIGPQGTTGPLGTPPRMVYAFIDRTTGINLLILSLLISIILNEAWGYLRMLYSILRLCYIHQQIDLCKTINLQHRQRQVLETSTLLECSNFVSFPMTCYYSNSLFCKSNHRMVHVEVHLSGIPYSCIMKTGSEIETFFVARPDADNLYY